MQLINHENILKIIKYKKISLKNINKKIAIKLYFFMLKLRLCEEALSAEYHPADEIRCPVHFCEGQEAVPAALNSLLENKDYLFSHHRSHGYYLAKNAPMKKLFAEIYGKETGANSGIAGSQDISYSKNNFFSGAILAGSVSIALGAAMTLQMNKKNKNVVVAGFGEAAADEGIFWESINYAGLKKLPIIFVCENNNYSVFSPQSKRLIGRNIAERSKAFGVKSKSIFGNDVCLIYRELSNAIFNARKTRGPFLLETFTYRYNGHVGPLSDDLVGYRTEKEISFWKKNCPILLLEEVLIKKKYLSEKDIKNMKIKINHEIKDSFNYAKKSNFPTLKSWEELNFSNKTPVADKILKDLEKKIFDENQKIIQVKGY